jgi:flagellar P-ring protein precursor FlgI
MDRSGNRSPLRRWIRFASTAVLILPLHLSLVGQTPENHTRLARVKDVATVEGIRDNQLIGYGIVVGLHGTGDTSQTVFPIQTLISTLGRMGVTLPQTPGGNSPIRVQNMAAVFVSGTLPPFIRPGSKVDVTVSSAGDARTLAGGMLLMTALYGPDGQIYAEAQGPLIIGGRIPSGAIVERGVPFDLKQMHGLALLLNDADFHTAEGVASAINTELSRSVAHAVDSRRITLNVASTEDIPEILARVEAINVHVYPRARVVVNERTGTVVIGGDVCLQPVSILHGGLSVNVVTEFAVSQPNPYGRGDTQVIEETSVQAHEAIVNRIELKSGATVDELVQNLQRIGATARDVISILQAMKEAGALEAELEVL